MEHIDEAQRTLERRALVNVRALIDKVEAEDRDRSANAVRFAVKSVPAMLVGLILLGGVAASVKLQHGTRLAVPHDRAEYFEQVFAKIEASSNARYRSELDGLNGRVEVAFDVKSNGYIDHLEITKSAFDGVIDMEATRIAKGLEPYLPLPPNPSGDPIHVRGTFHFASDSRGRGSLRIERTQ